jgi:hypothetical protein
MGADGGSIPDRRDLVKTKAKAETTDKTLLRELFFLCALSKVRAHAGVSHIRRCCLSRWTLLTTFTETFGSTRRA